MRLRYWILAIASLGLFSNCNRQATLPEKEIQFGDAYRDYQRQTPRLLPLPRGERPAPLREEMAS